MFSSVNKCNELGTKKKCEFPTGAPNRYQYIEGQGFEYRFGLIFLCPTLVTKMNNSSLFASL